MGAIAMSGLKGGILLLMTLVVVFLENWLTLPRQLLGAQIDLLPVLILYAALQAGLVMLTLIAIVGGLALDSLSANPLGVSIVPLFLVGFLIYQKRAFIVKTETYAQLLLGFGVCALVPAVSVFLLLTLGQSPLIGWGSLLQWAVMATGGALLTPPVFRILDRGSQALEWEPVGEPSFREDREIVRGRP